MIIIVIFVVSTRARLLEPLVFARSVIGDEVHYELYAALVHLLYHLFPIVQRAELVHYVAVVAYVVTVVAVGAFVARRKPHGVYAEIFEVIELARYPLDIPYAVAVTIHKATRVYLINVPFEKAFAFLVHKWSFYFLVFL